MLSPEGQPPFLVLGFWFNVDTKPIPEDILGIADRVSTVPYEWTAQTFKRHGVS